MANFEQASSSQSGIASASDASHHAQTRMSTMQMARLTGQND
jgi:hypothetical protein